MQINDQTVVNSVRFQNFIIFEPNSLRINETDILLSGYQVKEVFDEVYTFLSRRDSLQDLIIQNRLQKIEKMLDLVSDFSKVIVTKYFDRIWKRYSTLSHLGESFLDLKTYLEIFPELNKDLSQLLAARVDDVELD